MRVLAIEASTTSGGVAILEDDLLRASVSFTTQALYSQRLLPSVEWLLARCGLKLQDFTGVAVAVGPGSFTGLRIGLSAAKGLAYAGGMPIVGVATMEALAVRASCLGAIPMSVCVLLDARQGEVFAGLFHVRQANGEIHVERLRADHAGHFLELKEWVDQPTLFAGDALHKYRDQLTELFGTNLVPAHPLRNLPNAEEVGLLAMQRFKNGDHDNLMLLQPEYLRRSYAQPQAG